MDLIALEWQSAGDAPAAVLRGELDLSNVDALRRQLTEGVSNQAHGLVLDLSGVTYLDSTGLQLLFGLHRLLQDRQQSLVLVLPDRAPIRRVLDLAGLLGVVPVFSTLPEAMTRPRSAGRNG